MTPCPKCGGASSDPEFCSECGAAMAVAPVVQPPGLVEGSAEACPVCGEPRPGPFARFCDNCRYDFQTKQAFSTTPPAVPLTHAAPLLPAQGIAAPAQWDLHGSVDLSLRRADDPMPTDTRARIYPLDLADHLVGRRSDRQDIHPEIIVDDPGISRRHARILRGLDGALSLLDLGSMNGTRLDGAPVEPNVPVPLADGSQVTLGCWTRLTVKAR